MCCWVYATCCYSTCNVASNVWLTTWTLSECCLVHALLVIHDLTVGVGSGVNGSVGAWEPCCSDCGGWFVWNPAACHLYRFFMRSLSTRWNEERQTPTPVVFDLEFHYAFIYSRRLRDLQVKAYNILCTSFLLKHVLLFSVCFYSLYAQLVGVQA
jgi:hypothetical protein